MEHIVKDEVLTIFLKGKVNSSNSEEIEKDVDAVLNSTKFKRIVFDLTELEYISSAGLRIILKVKKQHDDLKLTNVSSSIYEILDMVGFNTIMIIEKK